MVNPVHVKEKVVVGERLSPEERDFVLEAINQRLLHRELAREAAGLVETIDRYREMQIEDVAAFLDRLAERLDNLSDIFARKIGDREPTMPKHAAECRAKAKSLRGEK